MYVCEHDTSFANYILNLLEARSSLVPTGKIRSVETQKGIVCSLGGNLKAVHNGPCAEALACVRFNALKDRVIGLVSGTMS